jgi:hypothetical protein
MCRRKGVFKEKEEKEKSGKRGEMRKRVDVWGKWKRCESKSEKNSKWYSKWRKRSKFSGNEGIGCERRKKKRNHGSGVRKRRR